MINFINIAIFVILSFFGIFLLKRAYHVRKLSRIAQTWPTTQATVLKSALDEEAARSTIGNINIAHILIVKYEYLVGNKTYQGDRVCFGRPAYNYITGSSFLDQFAVGTQVPVYYNPEKPDESVLAPKTTIGMPSRALGFFITASALIVGIYAVINLIEG